jgi:hypothetical protein
VITAEAAQSFIDVLKVHAQQGASHRSFYEFGDAMTLRCTYAPDMSYGRYHEPVRGNEQFEYHWEVWTRDGALSAPQHLERKKRGWVGLPHEGFALRLLTGEPWEDVKAAMLEHGEALAKVFS